MFLNIVSSYDIHEIAVIVRAFDRNERAVEALKTTKCDLLCIVYIEATVVCYYKRITLHIFVNFLHEKL